MAPRPRITVTPEELLGYRRIPGFSTTQRLSDRLDGSFTVASRGRSARRFYNPALPVDDPRREIGDATYYRLLRETGDETRTQARTFNAQRLRRRKRNEDVDRLIAEETGESFGQVRFMTQELARYNYVTREQHGILSMRDREAGGYLATVLEQLGRRPPGAPWLVGTSGSERALPGSGIVPANAMAQWRSQSAIRGAVA